MFRYVLRRIAYAIPIALSVSLVCFMLVHIAPGDPIDALVPPDTPRSIVEEVRKDYGLDKPLPVQFGIWLEHVVQGDFGRSIANRRPVLNEIITASGKTFLLAVSAASIGFLLGCTLGGLAAVFQGTWIDRSCVTFAVAGLSVPHYWLGMVLVILFSVELNLLPAMGAGPGDWAWNWEHIRFLILPVATLSVIPAGIITRKGLSRNGLLLHVVKNAAPTALAVMGLQLGYLMGGSILVESVFSWPGTGMMLNSAIFQRDIPVLQGTTLVLAMFFVMLNLIVDLVQTAIDPRMRRT